MADLIESVVDLTALRNRDELEFIVASVLFDLIRPTKLILWRVLRHGGDLRLQRRIHITLGRVAMPDTLVDPGALPLLDSRPELRACLEGRVSLAVEPCRNGRNGQVFGQAFPVTSEREVVGFLEVHHREPLLEEQARLVSGLLRIYRNYLRVLDYGECDELTGLLNRKTFDDYFATLVRPQQRLPEHAAQAKRLGRRRPASSDQRPWLAVADIDHFKRINDRFGHLYGDEVLVLMARLMRSSFRDTDRVFRFGGEEFVVVLAGTEAEAAEQVLERFRATVEDFDFPQVGRVTISIGYTCITACDVGSNAFGRADEALYVAKQRGRNQLLCYEHLAAQSAVHAKAQVEAEVELF
jgi:diguanylate cyclase (GGDEF)-like protein